MPKVKPPTTKEITLALYNTFLLERQHYYAVHNTQNVLSYCGESDFISINKTGVIYETEVKVSRSDFRNDFKKKDRHEYLTGRGVLTQNWAAPERWYTLNKPVNEVFSPEGYKLQKKVKRLRIKCYELQSFSTYDIPNYFYYAMPENLVKLDEIPLYCGVLYAKVQEYHYKGKLKRHVILYEARKPRRLTDRKVDDIQVHTMLRAQSYKWINELKK